jgi:hypothetical protein
MVKNLNDKHTEKLRTLLESLVSEERPIEDKDILIDEENAIRNKCRQELKDKINKILN